MTHEMYVPSADVMVILCDECWPPEPGERNFYLLDEETERKNLASVKVSEEGAEHLCQGHKHAVCEHIAEHLEKQR